MSLGASDRPSSYLFVSYAGVDRARVVQVADALRAAGVGIWIDQHDIRGGAQYGAEIGEGIRGCLAVALMCTNASLASRNVRQEIMLAWKYHRPYLPLLLERTVFPQDIEYWLEGSQWIEVLDRPEAEWLPRVLGALRQIESPGDRPLPSVQPSAGPPAAPPAATAVPAVAASRSNLPSSSPIVGRLRERQEIADLVRDGAERLLTLTGPGGTGKSRLAIQVGADLVEQFDEVVFVPLAPLAEATLVIPTIAGTLGLREEQQQTAADQLVAYLTAERALLILDNFEHLLEAAHDIADLLDACPGLRVLITSRGRLGLYGEQEYPVAPLRLPNPRQLPPVADLAEYEAVALFVQRARALKPDFALTDANAAAVAEICARLDGLPLAIELAAARVKLLTPQAMLARLDKRLPLLTGGARNLPARQQTLRNTIVWSYDLLRECEQSLFRRLSVFAGGWTFEAAEALAADEDAVGFGDVLDDLTSLVDKGLVRQEDCGGEARFSMLETIREFGQEQLAAAGETGAARRHAAYFLDLAEQAEPALTGPEQEQWFERLETEHDNLRAGLTWSLANDAALATGLAARLGRFWYLRGYFTEGRRWLETALANDTGESTDRASILYYLAGLAIFQGDYDRGRPWADEALRLYREGDHRSGTAMTLNVLGVIASHDEDFEQAEILLRESLDLHRLGNDDRNAAVQLGNLAWLAMLQQQHAAAQSYTEESLGLARRIGDSAGVAYALQNLGRIAFERGDIARANDAFIEGLTVAWEIGAPIDMTECLEGLAVVTAAQGQPEQAARMFGAAAESRIRINLQVPPSDQPVYDKHLALARDQLDESTWALAWAAGCRLSLGEAVSEALQAAVV